MVYGQATRFVPPSGFERALPLWRCFNPLHGETCRQAPQVSLLEIEYAIVVDDRFSGYGFVQEDGVMAELFPIDPARLEGHERNLWRTHHRGLRDATKEPAEGFPLYAGSCSRLAKIRFQLIGRSAAI